MLRNKPNRNLTVVMRWPYFMGPNRDLPRSLFGMPSLLVLAADSRSRTGTFTTTDRSVKRLQNIVAQKFIISFTCDFLMSLAGRSYKGLENMEHQRYTNEKHHSAGTLSLAPPLFGQKSQRNSKWHASQY